MASTCSKILLGGVRLHKSRIYKPLFEIYYIFESCSRKRETSAHTTSRSGLEYFQIRLYLQIPMVYKYGTSQSLAKAWAYESGKHGTTTTTTAPSNVQRRSLFPAHCQLFNLHQSRPTARSRTPNVSCDFLQTRLPHCAYSCFTGVSNS
jgi:hypothetical protein